LPFPTLVWIDLTDLVVRNQADYGDEWVA